MKPPCDTKGCPRKARYYTLIGVECKNLCDVCKANALKVFPNLRIRTLFTVSG